ncbi:Uncharacterized conserved protein [Salmonella enterica subsp. enterica serovar Typhimurium str. DT104]|nr:Uncharacterized conserved protein [Salmonella enterica subsp. enterica serovar Typhimurium str. DT104]
MDRPYRIQEGCFVLPETFTDRSVNIFILEGNERTSPSLNISRDTQNLMKTCPPILTARLH